MTTKYYRTLFQLEVLSDRPSTDYSISEIAHEGVEGDFSVKTIVMSVDEVNKEQMAELLIAQGSDPEFLIQEDDDEEDQ